MAFPLLAALATTLSLVPSPPTGSWWERLPARPGGTPRWLASGPDHQFVDGIEITWGKQKESSRWRVLREPPLWQSVFDGRWMIGFGAPYDFSPVAAGTPSLVPGYWNPFLPDGPFRFLDDDLAWRVGLAQLGKTTGNIRDLIDRFDLKSVTGDGMTFFVYTRGSETMVLRVVDTTLPSGESHKALRALPLPRGRWPVWDSILQKNGQLRPTAILGGVVLGTGKNHSQWRSLDSGKSWNEIYLEEDSVDIQSAVGASGDTFVTLLSNGRISKSFDKGANWSTSSKPQPAFVAPPVLARGRLWGIHQGNLLVSANFGNSWSFAKTGMVDVTAMPNGHLLATSEGGAVWESTPGDTAWKPLPDTLFQDVPRKVRFGSKLVAIGEKSGLGDLKILENGRWRSLSLAGIDDFEIVGNEFFASSHRAESSSSDTVVPEHFCIRIRESQDSRLPCSTNPIPFPYVRVWYSIAKTKDFQTWDTIFRRAASPFEEYEIFVAPNAYPEFDPMYVPGFATSENSLLDIDSAGRLEIRLRTRAYRSADGKVWKDFVPTRDATPSIDSNRVRVDGYGDIHILRSPEQAMVRPPSSLAAHWSIRGHRLSLELARPSRVRVDRIDPLGRSATLVEDVALQPGRQYLTLGGRSTGVGIYRIWIDGAVAGQILSADPFAP